MSIHGLPPNMPPAAIELPPDNFQQLCEYAGAAEAEPKLLSPAESRIVELQSGGMTVVDIAATLGIYKPEPTCLHTTKQNRPPAWYSKR